MKKSMIIAVCLLIATLTKAQFTITSVSPIQLDPGDTLTINFLYKGDPGYSIFTLEPQYGGGGQIWQYNNSDYYTMPKHLVGLDTIRTLKLAIPMWFPLGTAYFGKSWSKDFELMIGSTVGINAYTLPNASPTYYDMHGKVIQDPYGNGVYNTLLFMRVGDTYTKMMIKP